jgi:hypothetical protein
MRGSWYFGFSIIRERADSIASIFVRVLCCCSCFQRESANVVLHLVSSGEMAEVAGVNDVRNGVRESARRSATAEEKTGWRGSSDSHGDVRVVKRSREAIGVSVTVLLS